MKKIKNWVLVTAVVLSMALLASCSADSADKSSKKVSTTTGSKTEAASEKVSYPLTVTDSEGNKVTIKSKPKKVISMAPNITELMYKLGEEKSLVGRTDYCDYPKEAQNILSVGTITTPDMEKILSLDPDLVVASTHFSKDVEKQLTDLGIPVVLLYEEHKMDGVYSIIDILGTIMDQKATSGDLIKDMKDRLKNVSDKVSDKDKPSVYYVVGYGEYGDYTAGGDTFIGELINFCNGTNIAKDVKGWSYSLESLLKEDPDIIVIDNSMKDDFMKADKYKELSAVKNNKVYGIDKSILERQGYRNAEGVETLAKILHPDAFK